MIIDVILDRRDGCTYDSDSVDEIYEYGKDFEFNYICKAVKSKNERQMKNALHTYIDKNDYSHIPDIHDYIEHEDWLCSGHKQSNNQHNLGLTPFDIPNRWIPSENKIIFI